jgi:DNA modification methylase
MKRGPELRVVYLRISELKNNSRNSRTHSKRQIRQIAESIKAFGFTNPVLVDGDNTIVAGHGRVSGAKLLGMHEVPTIQLAGLTPDQIRAYVLADNRLAEKAGWDNSILAIELQHLLTIDPDFDVTITGFEIPEIDLILQEASQPDDETDKFEESVGPAVTRPGDLWSLDKHLILCGSAVDPRSFQSLMGKRRAAAVFVDTPYNVKIDGHVCGNGSIHHREFAMASGEMSEEEFTAFLETCFSWLARYSTNGSVHYVCMDWRHVGELLMAGREIYQEVLNLCVWVKDAGGMGSFYRSQHELVLVFRKGGERSRNNVQLGSYGRNRTNVWRYPGVNTMSKSGEEGNLLALHPTVKPVAMVADAILDCTARGEIVLDSFLGSGTTLLAAERTGRVCYGMEIDPLYVDTAIGRWQRYTGGQAIHVASGRSFTDVASEREAERERQ